MASINIAKYTSGAIKAMGSKHFDMEARLKLNHANEDITILLSMYDHIFFLYKKHNFN